MSASWTWRDRVAARGGYRAEAAARYVAALARLEPEEREAIIGRVEMDYSYADLADVLGKPTADAARKAARRALLRLAEEMKE